MYIDRLRNQHSVPSVLLRESFRADGKVRKRTIANLTDWPEHVVEGLQRLLRGESVGLLRRVAHAACAGAAHL